MEPDPARLGLLARHLVGVGGGGVGRAHPSRSVGRRGVLYASTGAGGIIGFERCLTTGALTPRAELGSDAAAGSMAVDPTGRFVYACLSSTATSDGPALGSWEVGPEGQLLPLGEPHPLADGSQFLCVDHTGRFVFTSYFRIFDGDTGGGIGLHATNPKGLVDRTVKRHRTAVGSHSVWPDPTNRWVFVPATDRNAEFPPEEGEPGGNAIFQFAFSAAEGRLEPHPTQPRVAAGQNQGPRHLVWGVVGPEQPGQMAYTSDEQGCSVTAYRLDSETGTLQNIQTITTVGEPVQEGWNCSRKIATLSRFLALPVSLTLEGITIAEIRIHPSGRFLFAPTRGHDTIATFEISPHTGLLRPTGRVPAPASPRGVNIAPDGLFLFAAGNRSARLVVYAIDQEDGTLTAVHDYELSDGRSSAWVLPLDLDDADEGAAEGGVAAAGAAGEAVQLLDGGRRSFKRAPRASAQ